MPLLLRAMDLSCLSRMIALSVSAGSIAALIGRRGFAFRPIGVFSGVFDLPYRRGLLALTKGIHGPPNTNLRTTRPDL